MTSIIRTITLAVSALLVSTTLVFAQSTSADVSQSQSASVQTAIALNATTISPAMSTDQMKTIRTGAMRQMINEQIAAFSTKSISEKLDGSFTPLTNGHSISFTSVVSASNSSIAGKNMIQTQVSYEARPIGGILTIKVSLVPMFPGIGSASRAIATVDRAQAVEDLDQDMVSQMVTDMTHQLGQQFAGK